MLCVYSHVLCIFVCAVPQGLLDDPEADAEEEEAEAEAETETAEAH